jgi:hypothetical protein
MDQAERGHFSPLAWSACSCNMLAASTAAFPQSKAQCGAVGKSGGGKSE